MYKMPAKFYFYIARVYVLNFLALTAGLLAIVYLFDCVELLRRAAKYDDVTLLTVFQLAGLKLPEVGQLIIPFAVLFSAMYVFWTLTKRYELIAARAAGLSIWHILLPLAAVSLLLGIAQFTAVNPVGALFLKKYENLERMTLNQENSLITISGQGLWLKQDVSDGTVILHAPNIDYPNWTLYQGMALFFDSQNQFIRRIDAQQVNLRDRQWDFQDISLYVPGQEVRRQPSLSLPTNLTRADIEDSFASADTVSFWALPGYIRTMEKTGFDPVRLRMHYQALLSQPLLYIAMILLAAGVSLRPPRSTKTFSMIVAGVMIGFVIFFFSSFLQALGATSQIPVFWAAWAPAMIATLIGLSVILGLEEG